MSGLHFYLERRIDKEKTRKQLDRPVILSFSFSSCRIKTYTGRKVPEQEWDKGKERVMPVYSKAEELNSYLDMLEKRVKAYFTEQFGTGMDPDRVRIQREIKKMVKSHYPLFFELFLRFIEENNGKWSLSTFKKVKTFYSQLKLFSIGIPDTFTPGMVNQALADQLVAFYRKKGLKDSSIKKNLDLLKWFMNWCLRKEFIFNRDYGHIRFSPVDNIEIHNEIYLKWEEITDFYQINGLTKKEEWCRDIFCFIVFTGIRFSKLHLFNKESISGHYIQAKKVNKVNKEKILLNRFSLEICKKYENKFYRTNTLFPSLSIITFHKHLRSAALKSGLIRPVFSNKSGFSAAPLYQLMSAQTAINSCFAHAVLLGMQGGLIPAGNSTKSRILSLSGAKKFAEEKQLLTTDLLYGSIRNSGLRP